MFSPLQRVRPGALISADRFNALVDAINRLSRITAAFPLEVHHTPVGVHLALAYGEREAHVELTSDLASGGFATAKILAHDGLLWNEAATPEITVHDAVGTFEGTIQDRGLVRFHRQSGLWIVWQLRC